MKYVRSTSLKMLLASTLVLGFLGCGDDGEDVGEGARNTTEFVINDDDSIVFTTKVGNVGANSDFYHVRQVLDDSNGRTLLSNGANYTGTITTTCIGVVFGSDYIENDCVTHYETNSPVGDPSDKTTTVRFYDGIDYTVYQEENSISSSDRITEAGGFSLNP